MKFGVRDFFWTSLQISFVVLKLCGVIDWSWWLVLSPMLAVLLYILCIVVALCVKNYAERHDRRTKEKLNMWQYNPYEEFKLIKCSGNCNTCRGIKCNKKLINTIDDLEKYY